VARLVRDVDAEQERYDAFMTPPARLGNSLVTWVGTSGSRSGEIFPWVIDTVEGRASLLQEISPFDDPRYVPQSFLPFGDRVYFAGFPGRYTGSFLALYLWSTDGTSEGTLQVVDSNGAEYEYPAALTLFGGKLYFFASTSDPSDYRLWRTDGTPEGSVSLQGVQGIPPEFVGFEGYTAVGIHEPPMKVIGDKLFFFGLSNRDPNRRYGLYQSDGTDSGTVFLADFSEIPDPIIEMGGNAYFVAMDVYGPSGHGRELWRTDGTAEGTRIVRDICPGPCDSSPAGLTVIGSSLYFVAVNSSLGRDVWKSDGTEAGTTLLKQFNAGLTGSPYGFTFAAGQVFFAADDGVHGEELWRTDGTASGTRLVKDLKPGSDSSGSGNFIPLGSWLVFSADDGVHGQELWRTDGTDAGTTLVADIVPGATGSAPQMLMPYAGAIFFSADDSVHGRELWRTDGTPAGTQLVADLLPGPGGSNPLLISNTSASLLLLTVDSVGLSLWETTGEPSGTQRIATLESGTQGLSSNPFDLTDVAGRLCFFTNSRSYGEISQLRTSDGTEAGTRLLQAIEPITGIEPGYPPLPLLSVGTSVYFDGFTEGGTVNTKFYRLDLDTNTLQPLADSFAYSRVLIGQTLFFSLNYSELWKTNVVSGEIGVVKKFAWISPLRVWQGMVYFAANNGGSDSSLWMSDGTEAGTVQISNSLAFSDNLTAVGKLFFLTSRDMASKKMSLWVVSPGAATAALLQAFPFDPLVGDSLTDLTGTENLLFFVYNDPQMGSQLWRSDGTATGTLLLQNGGGVSLRPDGSRIYFVAADSVNGTELWRSDGTPAGTFLVKDIRPGPLGSSPSELTVIDGVLLFSANDGVHGAELWRSDGTAEGTYLLDDISPGARSSNPSGFTKSGSFIYFAADDHVTGNELWAMPAWALQSKGARETPAK
jgi:ELWxxDGT repeat protein